MPFLNLSLKFYNLVHQYFESISYIFNFTYNSTSFSINSFSQPNNFRILFTKMYRYPSTILYPFNILTISTYQQWCQIFRHQNINTNFHSTILFKTTIFYVLFFPFYFLSAFATTLSTSIPLFWLTFLWIYQIFLLTY